VNAHRGIVATAGLALSPVLLLSGPARAQPARFEGLGFLPGVPPQTTASAISSDGSTVVGVAGGLPTCDGKAVRWTAPTGWQVMAIAGQIYANWSPVAVSADGSIVAGDLPTGGCSGIGTGARWTLTTGAVALSTPGPVAGMSADGSLIVGYAYGPGYPPSSASAWQWSAQQGHIQTLHSAQGCNFTLANAVSGNGLVIFGNSCGWCEWAGTNQPAPLTYTGRSVNAASFDGGSIVGVYGLCGACVARACRWTPAGGLEDLGSLSGESGSWVGAVSADGGVAVGNSGTPNTNDFVAVVWDQAHGMRDLKAVLTGLGLDLTGWTLSVAVGVSGDGRTIIGNGTDPQGHQQAWLAFLGDALNTCYANCDSSTVPPILNVSDFVCFQQRFAAGDASANCDGSTTPPVLNLNDFVCFQERFAAGCP
jgi:uncharacterized membrane protein